MQFSFSREQEDLRSTIRSYLDRHAGSEARNRLLNDGYSLDRELWRALAEQLGLHGLALPEEVGGSGAGFLETAIAMEELGRALYAGPFFSTVAASWVFEHADEPQTAALEALASGATIFTLAIVDPGHSWTNPGHATVATRGRDGHRISGTKVHVTDAGVADEFLVLAQLPEGPAWFAVPADAEGVTIDMRDALDLTRPIGKVDLHRAPARLIVGPQSAPAAWREIGTKAAVALAAEMVGGADAALRQSVAWSTERTQFNRPIGSFQAIKHMCADALVDVEAARLLTHYGAWTIDQGSPDRHVTASMAKQAAGDAMTLAAGNNIQIHGGIGFTWEHSAHLFFRRAKASSALFGTSSTHRSRVADLLRI